MPDFQAMYNKLFNAITDVIEILQDIQQSTEEIYISSKIPEIKILDGKPSDNDGSEN